MYCEVFWFPPYTHFCRSSRQPYVTRYVGSISFGQFVDIEFNIWTLERVKHWLNIFLFTLKRNVYIMIHLVMGWVLAISPLPNGAPSWVILFPFVPFQRFMVTLQTSFSTKGIIRSDPETPLNMPLTYCSSVHLVKQSVCSITSKILPGG